MKANELRLGNWISFDGKQFKCKPFDIKNIYDGAKTKYEPIPLTEEWLLKFGFEKDDVGWVINMNKETQLASGDEDSVWYIGSSIYWGEVPQNIKHVHTLQNLYFALTGEELQIKELND
jgi:hypothetical protein